MVSSRFFSYWASESTRKRVCPGAPPELVHPACGEPASPPRLLPGASPALMVGKRLMSWSSWLTMGLDREYSP